MVLYSILNTRYFKDLIALNLTFGIRNPDECFIEFILFNKKEEFPQGKHRLIMKVFCQNAFFKEI